MEAILVKSDGSIKTIEPKNHYRFSDDELREIIDCDIYNVFYPVCVTKTDFAIIVDAEAKQKGESLNDFATTFYGEIEKTIAGNVIICPICMA